MAHDDPSPDASQTQAGSARPDASAARLFSSLQSRAGHAVVVGDDPAAAEALFERVDAQLVCQRRARLSGEGLDLDTMVQALGTDLRGPYCPQEPDAILSLVATEARAAGLPILVVITRAEEAGAATLNQLATLVDSVPDARAAVRFVLLGGPRLEAILAQPEAQGLVARVLTTVRAPKREEGRWVFPLQAPATATDSPRRDTAQWIVAGLVALAGLVFFFAPWGGRDEPTRVTSTPSAPVWPADAPGTTVPAPQVTPPFPPMTAAPARPAPEQPPPAAAAPVPPAAASAPPLAAAPPPPAAITPPPPVEAPAPPSPVEGTVTPVPSAEREEYASGPADPLEDPDEEAERAPARDARPRATPDRRAAVPSLRAEASIGQSLQVGAFRQIANASALAQKLSADFPGVRIVTVERGGVRYHCVRLGGFADEYALAARASQLREAGYPAVRVQN